MNIDEIRDRLQLLETEHDDVLELANIMLSLVSKIQHLEYKVEQLEKSIVENLEDGR